MNDAKSQPPTFPDGRPKRPLSSFNLFYRFKRQKLLSALAENPDVDKDTMRRIVEAPPGLEGHTKNEDMAEDTPEMLCALRRKNIRETLEVKGTDARDTKARAHRKDKGALNGALSFVEMGKLMNSSWKACDDFARSVFDDISQEGRDRYRQLVEDYKQANHGRIEKYGSRSKLKKAKRQRTKLLKEQGARKKRRAADEEVDSPKAKKTKAAPNREDEKEHGAEADYSMAETMLQLTKQVPSKNEYKTCSNNKSSGTSGPTLLDLLSKNNSESLASVQAKPPVRNSHLASASSLFLPRPRHDSLYRDRGGRGVGNSNMSMARNDAGAFFSANQAQALSSAGLTNVLPSPKPTHKDPAFGEPGQASLVSPHPAQARPSLGSNLSNPMERQLALRVQQLEGQLAEERLRSRIRQLEDEMSQRKAREGMLRNVLDGVITSNRAAPALPPPTLASSVSAGISSYELAPGSSLRDMPATRAPAMSSGRKDPFVQDGLWSLVSASMIHPSVRAQERSAMLSRIVERPGSHARHSPVFNGRDAAHLPINKRPILPVSRGNTPEDLERF